MPSWRSPLFFLHPLELKPNKESARLAFEMRASAPSWFKPCCTDAARHVHKPKLTSNPFIHIYHTVVGMRRAFFWEINQFSLDL